MKKTFQENHEYRKKNSHRKRRKYKLAVVTV